MDKIDYALKTFHDHIESTGMSLNELEEKTILELGPGDGINSALIASAYGAEPFYWTHIQLLSKM